MKTIIFIALLALFVGGTFAQEVQPEVFLHPHGPRLLPHPHPHPHPHLKPPHHRPLFPGWKRSLPPLADLPPLPPLPAGIDCKKEVGNYLINHPQGSLSDESCSLLENDPNPIIKSIYNQACSAGAAPAPSAQEVQPEMLLHPHGPHLLPHPHPHPHPHPYLKPPHHLPLFPGWKRALPPLADLPPLPAGIDCKNEVGNYLINHPQGSLSDECCSLLENDPNPLIQSIYNQACSSGAAPTPSAQEVQPEMFLHPHGPRLLPHPHPHPHLHPHPHFMPPLHRPIFPGWKRALPPLADLPPLPPLPPLPAGIDCKNEVGNYLINHPQGSLSDECCSLLENDPNPLIKSIYNQACSIGAAPTPSA